MSDPSPDDDDSDDTQAAQSADLTSEIGDGEQPSTAVVRAVASLTGRSVLDLDPLYDVIDPDHLDALFDGQAADELPVEETTITFSFNNCHVTVTPDELHVRLIDENDG